MQSVKRISGIFSLHTAVILITMVLLCCSKRDQRLDKVVVHDNPLISLKGNPEVLLDSLNSAAAAVFVGDRIVFAEGGEGAIYEYRDKKAVPLITGFQLEEYGAYKISVLGIAATSDRKDWVVTASQDSGHVFLFNAANFPTTVEKGKEIDIHRTEPINPFGILITLKGLLVATGGTKSVYHGQFDRVNPNPLLPVFDVASGVEGIFEDVQTGHIYGAVVGTGKNDGSVIEWDPNSEKIQPRTIAEGFTNLVGVLKTPGGLLLTLEFGGFGQPESGRLSVIDLKDPSKIHPVVTGLDAPSGISLGKDNQLIISTFGKTGGEKSDGMLIRMTIVEQAVLK